MTAILSREEGRKLLSAPKKKSKYGNTRVQVDGIWFDSKREAAFYGELKQREKAGEVSGVDLQRSFALLGPQGMLMATYRCDFAFIDHSQDHRLRVVDVKGVETKEFKIKRRMMKALLGIDVEVIK
ncbi:putative conserved protein [Rhizobium favelukesii]|uniref:Conserved protein n=1 Tax=Rhizobium favelukesii TaxID=348824 RepID=W6R8Q7_9HYPH|nr:DUF1064 domain-containing protein [Rhizobium favelukesii]CDM57657.1 putative conserved protein [Rhizobium favelukesii]